jgi:hypothetical protein
MTWSRFGETLKAAATKIFVRGSAVGAGHIDRSGIQASPAAQSRHMPSKTSPTKRSFQNEDAL